MAYTTWEDGVTKSEWGRNFQTKASTLKTQGDSWRLKFDESIEINHPKAGWQQYADNTSAWFKCKLCHRCWPSNWVKVVFHMCLTDNKGVVKMRPYRQNCNKCHGTPMEEPRISSENVNALLENLLENIRILCYDEDLVRSY